MKHKDFSKLTDSALWLTNVLKQNLSVTILGPEEPPINRIRNEFLTTILVKIPNTKNVSKTKNMIRRIINSFETISQYKGVKTNLTVDY
jgi:primosomal protein N' (replication factor Y)